MFNRILLAADDSEASEPAIQQAFSLVQKYAQTLVIVTVVDIYGAYYATPESIEFIQKTGQAFLDSLVTRATAQHILAETSLLETDISGKHISEILVAEAKRQRANIMVLGSHDWHGLRQFLSGGIAQAVCRLAPCSVLIARAENQGS